MTSQLPSATWDRPGTRALEYIFVGSAPIAIFIVLGFVLESFIEGRLLEVLHASLGTVYLSLFGLLYAGTWFSVRAFRRRHPAFLTAPSGYRAGEVAAPFLGWFVAVYLVTGLATGLITFVWVDRTDHHWPMVVLAFAVWFPLFFALPIGAVVAWLRIAAHNQHAG